MAAPALSDHGTVLERYLDDQMRPDERRAFEARIARDPELQGELRSVVADMHDCIRWRFSFVSVVVTIEAVCDDQPNRVVRGRGVLLDRLSMDYWRVAWIDLVPPPGIDEAVTELPQFTIEVQRSEHPACAHCRRPLTEPGWKHHGCKGSAGG